MFPLSPSKTLTRLAFATGLLSKLVLGVTIDDVFRVKEGTEKGGCDAYKADLALWFEDAIKLADIAAAGIAATDDKTREYLDGFFSIGPGGDTSAVSLFVSRVQKVLSNEQIPPGGKPWLFCDSTWLEEQAWDAVLRDSDGNPQEDGETAEQKYEPTDQQKIDKRPFWSAELGYIFFEPGDYCTLRKKKSDPLNQGATQDLTEPNTVTLCINNFPSGASTLAQIASVDAPRISIKDRQANSLTLFHELFHLSSGSDDTPDHSYELSKILNFPAATAVQNPESYSFYALALYLGQQNPVYTFASGRSVKPRRTRG
ncbi:hypothetical protein EDB81DRAFT_52592 [Dactylonectria macrodidyma]|uniref:Lysine-specific metallo-endopeptidase domain-containing protein n=1 Tax=Dactylonectria macrodidyma TaxID=307937 RepID=A0A9P9J4E4_9HYPO|nr:hypothetical protein EDB81DRAFT_52592 [Dactylonectria macrodidyma]